MIKKTIPLIIVAILMIGVCGCMNTNGKNKLVDRMIDYMNAKYDDTFVFVRVFGGTPWTKTHKIYAESEKYPGRYVTVECYSDRSEEIFYDNYMGVVYEADTEDLIRSIISDCFSPECFISYGVNNIATSSSYSRDTSFADYIAEPGSGIFFTAIVKYDMDDAAKEAKAMELERRIVEAGLCCGGKIYLGKDIDNISTLTDENYYLECLKDKKYDRSLYFNMTSNDGFEKTDWEGEN